MAKPIPSIPLCISKDRAMHFKRKYKGPMMIKIFFFLLFSISTQAQATTYLFSYTRAYDSKVLSGALDGTLQADNNVVVVNALLGAPTLSGVTGPLLPFVSSTDQSNFGTVLSPRVSVDGSFMDFIACDFFAGCNGLGNAFTFNAGNRSGATYGTNGTFTAYDGFFGASFGGFAEEYSASRWTLTPVPAVPEPSSSAFVLAGLAILFVRRHFMTSVNRQLSSLSRSLSQFHSMRSTEASTA